MKVARSCAALCDPTDYTVHGILQARILEWVAVSSPGAFPAQGLNPGLPHLQVDSLPVESPGKPGGQGGTQCSSSPVEVGRLASTPSFCVCVLITLLCHSS